MNEQRIFDAARQLDEQFRSDFLDKACGLDADLRNRIEALLAAHTFPDSLLDCPADDLPTTETESSRLNAQALPAETEIGNYKLLQRIGEGGMGSVYMAEQLQPVRRVVALKVVKAGLDSKQVVARFEAERQTLALMDHPNIAKVLDAGATERGEPFFVMELVKGVPLTEYCDTNRITTRARIQLVADVCHAVQHAHQKGIIHRDLKPSNILVAQYDDRPVPKVIDFGVAKATHQKLTEKTLYTQLGQIVGTLEYMSPEQAVLNQLDVDTRTDVYSLGVILYELLVGETPLASKELRSQGLDHILRTIREQEPARPSVRLSCQGQAASQTAAYRSTDTQALSRVLRGDLDWIVMKALEKDRTRRYESASRLAEDLKHYLAGETVQARPPTASYRLRKAWQRNRVLFSSVAAVILALAIGFLGMLRENGKTQIALQRVTEERESKERLLLQNQQQSELLAAQLARAENALSFVRDYCMLHAMTGDPKDLETALQIATATNSTDTWKRLLKGQSASASGNHPKALGHFKQALEAEPNSIIAQSLLATEYAILGDFDEFSKLSYGLAQSTVPVSPEEQVYFAYGMMYDSQKAFELIESVVSQRDTPLANLVFAEAVDHFSSASSNPKTLAEAIRRLEDVRTQIGNSYFFASASLRLRHHALLNENVTAAEQEGHQRQAERDIELLSQHSSNHAGQLNIASYLTDFAPEQSDAAWEAILDDPNALAIHSYAVRALTLREDTIHGYAAAAKVLKGNEYSISRMWYAYCLHRIGANEHTRSEYGQLKQEVASPYHNHLYYLSLTGPLSELSKESDTFLKEVALGTRELPSRLVELQARYYADPQNKSNEAQLREAFSYGTGLWVTAVGTIGRVRVLQYEAKRSEATRQAALEIINEIINSQLFLQGDHYWAKSMKVRLEAATPSPAIEANWRSNAATK